MVPESHPATSGFSDFLLLPGSISCLMDPEILVLREEIYLRPPLMYEAQKSASKQFMSSNAMEAMMGTWISEVGPSSDQEMFFFVKSMCQRNSFWNISKLCKTQKCQTSSIKHLLISGTMRTFLWMTWMMQLETKIWDHFVNGFSLLIFPEVGYLSIQYTSMT